jgi:hypothetical protein
MFHKGKHSSDDPPPSAPTPGRSSLQAPDRRSPETPSSTGIDNISIGRARRHCGVGLCSLITAVRVIFGTLVPEPAYAVDISAMNRRTVIGCVINPLTMSSLRRIARITAIPCLLKKPVGISPPARIFSWDTAIS